jgi:nucleoside-diphosphate-sugar epimerase
MRVLIIGVNGFIGNALVKRILKETDWQVAGIDIDKDRLNADCLSNPKFEFYHGDITINRDWVEFQVKRSDVVLPLAAVAVPKFYVENPLMVFELDFLENLKIIQHCAKYKKRIVFPSTSEVYGMCADKEFDEESSNLVTGPINKHRWIYSNAKQLLDRVIHAYGFEQKLNYTLFRPFNWIGPHLDRIDEKKIGNSRVLTQFVTSVVHNREITLVDGGLQRRSFLYLDDGISGLLKILQRNDERTFQKIFNLGNPENEISIQELAKMTVDYYQQHPRSKTHPFTAGITERSSATFYGAGYQDVSSRMPSIARAKTFLDWSPNYSLKEAVKNTLESFLSEL